MCRVFERNVLPVDSFVSETEEETLEFLGDIAYHRIVAVDPSQLAPWRVTL